MVTPSFSQELQKCFDVKDVQMLQDAISKMDPTVSILGSGLKFGPLSGVGELCVQGTQGNFILCSCIQFVLYIIQFPNNAFSQLNNVDTCSLMCHASALWSPGNCTLTWCHLHGPNSPLVLFTQQDTVLSITCLFKTVPMLSQQSVFFENEWPLKSFSAYVYKLVGFGCLVCWFCTCTVSISV